MLFYETRNANIARVEEARNVISADEASSRFAGDFVSRAKVSRKRFSRSRESEKSTPDYLPARETFL